MNWKAYCGSRPKYIGSVQLATFGVLNPASVSTARTLTGSAMENGPGE